MNTTLANKPLNCAFKAGKRARSSLVTAAAISLAVGVAPTLAEYRLDSSFIDYARVVQVEPVYETVTRSIPKERCWDERVHQPHGYSQPSATPTIIGALIGGAIGNELGHHKRNKQVGAVVGGILGGSIGRDIGREAAAHDRYGEYTTVERCKVHYRTYEEQELLGYDVTYRYQGNEYSTQMSEHPGKKMRVSVSVLPAI